MITAKKISGSTATLLVDSTDRTTKRDGAIANSILNTNPVDSISITNIHATDEASVDLYLTDSSTTYYIFKGLEIPAGVTLFLEDQEIQFPRETYNLYIKLGASGSTVDVLMRRKI